MTDGAGVRNFQSVGLAGRDEMERMTTHIHVGDGLFDLGHVAGDALAPRAADFMMGVLLYAGGMGAILRVRSVTG